MFIKCLLFVKIGKLFIMYDIIFPMVQFYKEKLTFIMTAISGCLAWLFVNYLNYTMVQMAANIIAIAFLGIFGVKTVMSIKFCLVKIKESI